MTAGELKALLETLDPSMVVCIYSQVMEGMKGKIITPTEVMCFDLVYVGGGEYAMAGKGEPERILLLE